MNNRIRELRRSKGITMKQLGSSIGMAESTISQYENGKRQPDNVTLVKLAKFFNVSVGYIIGVEQNTPAVVGKRVNQDDMQLTRDELEMIRKFRQLDRRGKSAVLSILEHEYAALPGGAAAPAPKQA